MVIHDLHIKGVAIPPNKTHTILIVDSNAAITRDLLVGKDLPRVYQFTADGKLIIRSARPDEHWSVTWEHY